MNHRQAAPNVIRFWMTEQRPCQQMVPPELVVQALRTAGVRIGPPRSLRDHPSPVLGLVVLVRRERFRQLGLDADEPRSGVGLVLYERVERRTVVQILTARRRRPLETHGRHSFDMHPPKRASERRAEVEIQRRPAERIEAHRLAGQHVPEQPERFHGSRSLCDPAFSRGRRSRASESSGRRRRSRRPACCRSISCRISSALFRRARPIPRACTSSDEGACGAGIVRHRGVARRSRFCRRFLRPSESPHPVIPPRPVTTGQRPGRAGISTFRDKAR